MALWQTTPSSVTGACFNRLEYTWDNSNELDHSDANVDLKRKGGLLSVTSKEKNVLIRLSDLQFTMRRRVGQLSK